MNYLVIGFMALALGGCATRQPAVEIRTVEVPVLRVETCFNASDLPKVPAGLPKRPSTVSSALDIAVAKVIELQGYAAKANALLNICAKKDEPK